MTRAAHPIAGHENTADLPVYHVRIILYFYLYLLFV